MNVDDDAQWRALMQDWNAAPRAGAVPFPSTQDVRRRARLQSLLFAGELLLCGVVLVLLLWRARAGADPLVTAAGAAFTLFALAASVWAWRARTATALESVQDALDSALAQTQVWLRWIRSGHAICVAALLYLALLFWRAPGMSALFVLAGVLFVALTLAALFFLQRQQRRRLAGLRVLRAELSDEPEAGA